MELEPYRRALRILVADGHADAAESLLLLLQLWGHQAWAASTSTQALELAATHHPEVVLLEGRLPDLEGCAVAERLKGRAVVIAVTTTKDTTGGWRWWQAGVALRLLKPVEPEVLRRLLTSVARCKAQALLPRPPAGRVRGRSSWRGGEPRLLGVQGRRMGLCFPGAQRL
jgi:DNA-binding response OmpR family regulator